MRAIHGDSDTSSSGSTDGASETPVLMMSPDDYTTLPSIHPSQQLLKASLFRGQPVDLQAASFAS